MTCCWGLILCSHLGVHWEQEAPRQSSWFPRAGSMLRGVPILGAGRELGGEGGLWLHCTCWGPGCMTCA